MFKIFYGLDKDLLKKMDRKSLFTELHQLHSIDRYFTQIMIAILSVFFNGIIYFIVNIHNLVKTDNITFYMCILILSLGIFYLIGRLEKETKKDMMEYEKKLYRLLIKTKKKERKKHDKNN